ncbi:MAG: prepilin-type N-terminal cleavage/methylation domain-containing protein [Alphaproteobacteria bacterium]|nr:prepilin-type N-terminal cleavage/methylation domain-containing protein [Alphaproteobacteria bacterium]MCB9793441.1 prepilin-type N-terminal cleavage/methylation domain-containing protein [Alphaproteobacteria bacterium]
MLRSFANPRRGRSGVTLLEILVVIVLLMVVLSIAVPAVSSILLIEQSGAAKELGLTYKYLRDEAALRNVTFRVVYNLDTRSYKVEVGDPNTLIFSDPDDRAEWEEDFQDQLSRFTDRELEEGKATELQAQSGRFDNLTDPVFRTEVKLPTGSTFAWVWTPQYDEPVEPNVDPDEEPSDDEAEQAIAYSYVFPNGFIEHTVVRIASIDDPEEGYTVEVEPVSGKVTVTDEIISYEDSMSWVPHDAPEMPL